MKSVDYNYPIEPWFSYKQNLELQFSVAKYHPTWLELLSPKKRKKKTNLQVRH